MQQIRKSYGYTQEKLAEAIDVSTRYVGEVEQERVQPSYEVLIRFCNTFNIGMDEIFSKYLDKTEKKQITYTLAGYDQLKEKDKQLFFYVSASKADEYRDYLPLSATALEPEGSVR